MLQAVPPVSRRPDADAQPTVVVTARPSHGGHASDSSDRSPRANLPLTPATPAVADEPERASRSADRRRGLIALAVVVALAVGAGPCLAWLWARTRPPRSPASPA